MMDLGEVIYAYLSSRPRMDGSRVREIKCMPGDLEKCWPPLDWRKLTADQRLLALEYEAISLKKLGKIGDRCPFVLRQKEIGPE
ncbi:hypothetical protein DPMN_120239 [Dreissena polymorpha]|uniref:Uncharacterized protein n=1 Tax=Dreissena polymorpha TaxID=45954 RepID=A0A9D4GMX5_DREPO|nr:hypothetical protein DPMN_120239 [Dreissena polymorpha]